MSLVTSSQAQDNTQPRQDMKMNMTSLLMDMPDDLVFDICVTWLDDMRDIAHLDSALCNLIYRPTFLRLLSQHNERVFFSGHNTGKNYPFGLIIPSIKYCRWLMKRKINVHQLRNMTFAALKPLLMKGCSILQNLAILECTGNYDTNEDCSSSYYITDQRLGIIGSTCPLLEGLNIDNCSERISDAGIIAIGKGCQRLQSLNLGGCYYITDVGMNAIAQGCKDLQMLNLRRCMTVRDFGLRCIANGCRSLKSLSIAGCYHLTDEGIVAIAECCSLILFSAPWCNITDGGLRSITRGCPQLQSLDIGGCKHLTNGALRCLSQCRLLRELSLSECRELNDYGLRNVARSCPALTSLKISKCKMITGDGIIRIATGCPKLIDLHMGGCPNVSHQAVCFVVENLKDLETLVVGSPKEGVLNRAMFKQRYPQMSCIFVNLVIDEDNDNDNGDEEEEEVVVEVV